MILAGGRKAFTAELKSDRDVALARRRVGDLMKQQGSRDLMQTRFVTAVSEIARNAIVHGGGGKLVLYTFPGQRKIGAEISDIGSGIADVGAALADGFSTGSGLGRGLGGAKRLASAFEIESAAGKGTVVRMTGQLQTRP